MYQVYDLETENRIFHRRRASPFDPSNWVVAVGWKQEGDEQCSWTYHPEHDRTVTMQIGDQVDLLVGFNIKFDLLWLWDKQEMKDFLKRGGTIWCCQLAEYFLQAQHPKYQMCALNDIAQRYGGTKKIDAVKELWDAGYLTSEIPEDLLIDYLVGTEQEGRNGGDIGNTEKVYLGQVEKAKKLGMYHSIQQRMRALLATTMMEYNGLKIDMQEAMSTLAILRDEFYSLEDKLNEYIPEFPEGALDGTQPLEFSWKSKHHISALIFGGAIKYRVRVPKIVDGCVQRKKVKTKWPLFQGVPYDPALCEKRTDWSWELLLSGEEIEKHTLKRKPCGAPNSQIGSETELRLANSSSGPLCENVSMDTGTLSISQDRYLSGKKKGEPKFGNVEIPGEIIQTYEERIFDFPGYIARSAVETVREPKKGWVVAKAKDARGVPLMRCGSESLEILGRLDVPFCKTLARYAALAKDIGTYYARLDEKTGELKGMLTCVEKDTRMIHHKLNHSSTITTRLSSNDPNLQNLPRGDKSKVKAMFVSRFGDQGVMIEADYSQLEIVGQAFLTGDHNLIRDLKNKVDFHCKRVGLKNHIPYEDARSLCKNEDGPNYSKWKKERTNCKVFSFQRAYGAGPKTIAKDTGMTLEEVKALIEAENKEYPMVPKFFAAVTDAVVKSAKKWKEDGRTVRRGWWQAPTGTMYTWRSYAKQNAWRNNSWEDSFSPPEILNYPVQGTSGEFVQCALGALFDRFIETDNYNGKAFLVNTVHDCTWTDSHKDVMHEVAKDVKQIMESIPALLKMHYNLESPVEFPVDVECGPNMYDLKHFPWRE